MSIRRIFSEMMWKSPQALQVNTPRRRAFTLIELLIVVGIIGVLVAVLLPALSRAFAQAAGIKCVSNLRQIGQAELIYAANFRGYFVFSATNSSTASTIYWDRGPNPVTSFGSDPAFGWLALYGTTPNVYVCPGMRAAGRTVGNADSPVVQTGPTSYIFGRCYGWNQNLASMISVGSTGYPSYTVWSGCRPSSLANSSNTMLTADLDNMRANVTVTLLNYLLAPSGGNTNTTNVTANQPTFSGTHLGKGGVLWSDVHCSLETPHYMAPGTTGTELISNLPFTATQAKNLHIGFLCRSDSDLFSGSGPQMDFYFNINKR